MYVHVTDYQLLFGQNGCKISFIDNTTGLQKHMVGFFNGFLEVPFSAPKFVCFRVESGWVQYEPASLGTNAFEIDKIPEHQQRITCVLYSTGECRIPAIRSRYEINYFLGIVLVFF